jgi:hypothetical protein
MLVSGTDVFKALLRRPLDSNERCADVALPTPFCTMRSRIVPIPAPSRPCVLTTDAHVCLILFCCCSIDEKLFLIIDEKVLQLMLQNYLLPNLDTVR